MALALIITGGPILTMASTGAERAEALALEGERILHAGTLGDCRTLAGRDREERDLGGRTLMPAFVDAHAHPLMLGQTESWVNVAPTVVGSIDMARRFIETNPVENLQFRLAGGLLGILAAVNEEVEWSYKWNLILVMVTVFVLSVLTYASVVGALIVMIPSIVAQPLSEAVMYAMGVDANINSLPVAAVGIGIGIDYGYYVLSRIVEEFQRFGDHEKAIEEALMTTGRAIMFTGTTLTVSVIFWIFFPMKFQSEMAILLTILLFFHVVGALAFIPGLVSLLKPRFPLPNKVMTFILFLIFTPAAALYYFDYANLLTLGMLALVVGIGEHLWATRQNIGMELRG